MLPHIQLLAVDLDGTTLSASGAVSARVREALARAAQRRLWITLATGRNLPSARPFAEVMHINAPIICLQGSLIYDLAKERVLRRCTLPSTLICDLLAAHEVHWPVAAYRSEQIFVVDPQLAQTIYAAIRQEPTQVPDLCQALHLEGADKLLFHVPEHEIPHATHVLRNLVRDQAHVVQSDKHYVEVIPKDADKGNALRWLAQYLGVPREAVMAIGDQDNDAAMLAWAGLGVAMGNGSEAAKAAAAWIAPSIEQDGAAVAIERFVLR